MFKKNKKDEDPVFQQDLSNNECSGLVFMMQLLMKNKCSMPEKSVMEDVMVSHFGDVESFCHSSETAGFAVNKYKITAENKELNPLLMITGCCEFNADKIDDFTRSQMWNCKEKDRVLSECRYQVVATDMLSGALDPHDRADMLMDYLEALIELYPDCEAVYFYNSGKMFTSEMIRNHSIPKEDRFIYFAVNVRFFNIQGTDDKVIDTLGMSVLSLPDVQYHFHGVEPDDVVNHAYNVASYIFANNNPINDNETIDGIFNGKMDSQVQWHCHYEMSLIQPAREVIDICMNEYAAGNREYE